MLTLRSQDPGYISIKGAGRSASIPASSRGVSSSVSYSLSVMHLTMNVAFSCGSKTGAIPVHSLPSQSIQHFVKTLCLFLCLCLPSWHFLPLAWSPPFINLSHCILRLTHVPSSTQCPPWPPPSLTGLALQQLHRGILLAHKSTLPYKLLLFNVCS